MGVRRKKKYGRNFGKCVGIYYYGPTASNRNIHFVCLTRLRLCTSVTAVVAAKTAGVQGEAAYTSDERETFRLHEL